MLKTTVILNALAILDVAAHNSDVLDCHASDIVMFKIENSLDAAVSVQFRGSFGRSAITVAAAGLTNPDNVGTPVTVIAISGSTPGTETRIAQNSGGNVKLPLMYCVITALTLPTTGTITITAFET